MEAKTARALYTAEATVTGGRANGHGRTSDGMLEVQLRRPKEMGGEGDGTNPEQLFAVGYAACFEGALGVIGRREHVEVGDVSIRSRVSLLSKEGRAYRCRGAQRDLAAGKGSGRGGTDRRRGAPGLPVLERDPGQHRGQADRQRPRARLNAARTGYRLEKILISRLSVDACAFRRTGLGRSLPAA